MKPLYLLLENGCVFKGGGFGAELQSGRLYIGETVFTTAMTGYIETLTDPSYCNQFVVQTFPAIGNYGMILPDCESQQPALAAYIVREYCEHPSNFRCEMTLTEYLKNNGIPGLYGVDTRALTRNIREHGTMNGLLTAENPQENLAELLDKLKQHKPTPCVPQVTVEQPVSWGEGNPLKILLYHFGAKQNIVNELVKRGCHVIAVPAGTTTQEALSYEPHGILLSNGPGDPADYPAIANEIKGLMDQKIPMFGICLGHQLMAMAAGAKTGKLKYGHRGANQPVKQIETGKIFMTSQNHGYAVTEIPPESGVLSYRNENDFSCEGIDYCNIPAFSVQFHPEACGGPLDTNFLFDRFIQTVKEHMPCH